MARFSSPSAMMSALVVFAASATSCRVMSTWASGSPNTPTSITRGRAPWPVMQSDR